MGHAPLDGHAEMRHVRKLIGVVRFFEDRLAEVFAHLVNIDVERGGKLDVTDMVTAEVDVHQARNEGIRIGILIVLNALH